MVLVRWLLLVVVSAILVASCGGSDSDLTMLAKLARPRGVERIRRMAA